MKFLNTEVLLREIPNEVSLGFWISGCPNHCHGCHSPELWEDKGADFDIDHIEFELQNHLIALQEPITCVAFMGGDQDPQKVIEAAYRVKFLYPNIKVAWYSGSDLDIDRHLYEIFDYLKTGPYKAELGPLTSKTTNQHFYVNKDDGFEERFFHE